MLPALSPYISSKHLVATANCLEDKREDYQKCSVLYCVTTVLHSDINTHTHTYAHTRALLKVDCRVRFSLDLGLLFVLLLCHFVSTLLAFVVSGLASLVLSQEMPFWLPIRQRQCQITKGNTQLCTNHSQQKSPTGHILRFAVWFLYSCGLNEAAAMQPYVRLLWPLVIKTSNRNTQQTSKDGFANSLASSTLMQRTQKRLFVCCFITWQEVAETGNMIQLMTELVCTADRCLGVDSFAYKAFLPACSRNTPTCMHFIKSIIKQHWQKHKQLEMWANAQRDGRPAEYRWRPLFNAVKFGWRPLSECRAVMLPRRKTHWN